MSLGHPYWQGRRKRTSRRIRNDLRTVLPLAGILLCFGLTAVAILATEQIPAALTSPPPVSAKAPPSSSKAPPVAAEAPPVSAEAPPVSAAALRVPAKTAWLSRCASEESAASITNTSGCLPASPR